jgi:hypothetical protein
MGLDLEHGLDLDLEDGVGAGPVVVAPAITLQPLGPDGVAQLFVDSGANAETEIEATGTDPTFQWYRGRTAASLTLLNGNHDDVDTTLAVDDGTVFFVGDVIQATGNTEKMLITGISGNTLTVTRGAFSTSGQAMLDNAAINAIEQSISGQTTAAYSAAHNVTTNPAARLFCRVSNAADTVDSDPCFVHVIADIASDAFDGGNDTDISSPARTLDNVLGGSGTRTWQMRDVGTLTFNIASGALTWTGAEFRRLLTSDALQAAQGYGMTWTAVVLATGATAIMQLRDSGADSGSFRSLNVRLREGAATQFGATIPTLSVGGADIPGISNLPGTAFTARCFVFDTADGVRLVAIINGQTVVKEFVAADFSQVTGAQLADFGGTAHMGARSHSTAGGAVAVAGLEIQRMHLGGALIDT